MAPLWLAYLASVFLNTYQAVLFAMANTDFCGSVFESHVDHVLVGHVMGKADVADQFECHLKCLGNNSCKSFNVHPDGNNVKRICELNNKTRHMKPGHFKRKKGSTYYGSVQISCMDGSRDFSKATSKPKCHPGFAGMKCSVMRGSLPSFPARSCKDIRKLGGSNQNGEYWIDPENKGDPLKVYCDMLTDGGGWLLIANIVNDDGPPNFLNHETSYRGITRYSDNNMALAPLAFDELRTHLPFTQLRFHCSKQQGRTFHITTVANSTGEAVIQYFSGQTDVLPNACGSYVRLHGDSSYLAGDCARWGKQDGKDEVGKWGRQHVWMPFRVPAFISGSSYWVNNPGTGVWSCDDTKGSSTSPGDYWKIYVR